MNEFDDVVKNLNKIKASGYKMSLGFDGYADEIISAVDSRTDSDHFKKITSISNLGNRILSAAGKSTNIELVTQQWKLGGNGPILGNSIAHLGIHLNYVGALGYPEVHKVYSSLHDDFEYITIDEPGHTMALEFEDGKIMLGRLAMKNLDWSCITRHVSEEKLKSFFYGHDMLGMVNWTQTPHMSAIWDKLLNDYLPSMPRPSVKPYLFVDIADPQKRDPADIQYMISQLGKFEKFYRVVLGLNEKESQEIATVLNIGHNTDTSENLQKLSKDIRAHIKIYCCVIHPVKYAVCAIDDKTFYHSGPYIKDPLISTGAGDHFNAGFCFGMITGLSPLESLITGVANSGFYVRTAKSATLEELIRFINDWKNQKI